MCIESMKSMKGSKFLEIQDEDTKKNILTYPYRFINIVVLC